MAVALTDVQAVYPTATQPMLDVANVLINTQLLNAGLDPTLLDKVTIYLAAHFASITDGILRRQRLGDGDESYKTPGDADQGLRATLFGQQAMILDTSGILAEIGSRGNSLPALFTTVGCGSIFPFGWI